MQIVPQQVKENPIKSTIGAVMALSAFIGVFFAIDGRYAHAGEMDKLKQETNKTIREMRVQQIEDEIFKLNFKVQTKEASPLDKAMLERYKNQRETILKDN